MLPKSHSRPYPLRRRTVFRKPSMKCLGICGAALIVIFQVVFFATVMSRRNNGDVTLSNAAALSETVTTKNDVALSETVTTKNERNPRIAILVGPHKTASTTLQVFFAKYLGFTVSQYKQKLSLGLYPKIKGDTQATLHKPLPFSKPDPMFTSTNWVWPLPVREEYHWYTDTPVFRLSAAKFYSPVSSLIGKKPQLFNDWNKVVQDPKPIYDFIRELFRQPWENGKNIVFGSEELDAILSQIHKETAQDRGEELHVAPNGSDQIDILLDLLPWGKQKRHIGKKKHQPLHLEDIEVIIFHREPRLAHVQSLWRESAGSISFRDFLTTDESPMRPVLHATDSLALALQYVRKGIPTTIVNLKGLMAHDAQTPKLSDRQGGPNAVVACEILQMGKNNNTQICDDQNRLLIPDHGRENSRSNTMPVDLNDNQLDAINRAYEQYDCDVWRYLKKYQDEGILRVLYSTPDLFASCKPEAKPFSFSDLMEKMTLIASSNSTMHNP